MNIGKQNRLWTEKTLKVFFANLRRFWQIVVANIPGWQARKPLGSARLDKVITGFVREIPIGCHGILGAQLYFFSLLERRPSDRQAVSIERVKTIMGKFALKLHLMPRYRLVHG